ncbi:MAG TPA: LmbE family protein, partial [Salinimicrobium sp.]|nr:LmbE family protein [Salinimicrobium sp.]
GIIRTQELLRARRIDGGLQFFTRANDFGYSKTPEETLRIWNEKEVLSDVVWIMRTFRPDVVINRFSPNSAGETHGHHTSSAILSVRAFELAGKEDAFPLQLQYTQPWEPEKLFFNTSSWFYDSEAAFEKDAASGFLKIDTGVYYPLLGLSNTEIASMSRSSHRSQGFGSSGTRGIQTEYLVPIAGHQQGTDSIFSGINTTWSRLENGEAIGEILTAVAEDFHFSNPATEIPRLLKAYQLIKDLNEPYWKKIKLKEIKEIIAASAGLYLEAVASVSRATPGEEITLDLEAINRSGQQMQLISVEVLPGNKTISTKIPLANNTGWQQELNFSVPQDQQYSTPYWLREKGSLGMYSVDNQNLIGLPENPGSFKVVFTLSINGTEIPFSREIIYKYTDPVMGEVYRPFEIVPPVSLSTADEVIIFAGESSREVPVRVKSFSQDLEGSLTLGSGAGWKVSPSSFSFKLAEKGEEKLFTFKVTPPPGQAETIFKPIATVNGKEFSTEVIEIEYPHIPLQTLVLPAAFKMVKLDIKTKGELIGYIEGAGDGVHEALEQMGYNVVTLDPHKINSEDLEKFQAVVTGIRAYNVVKALGYKQDELLQYVKNGGNLIIQYNTNRGLETQKLAPYPLELSRDRVTDENAKVEILAPDHRLVNFPNKITAEDFEGWVQERGLYFPDQWSDEFTPVLSMKDPGEDLTKGSLLVAPYGEGYYIYTGLSFFREFPAGVPGAFRLFANLVSMEGPKE